MDSVHRKRLEQLEALIDAAPSPLAWVELCAALSEWPDDDELALGIEFVRTRMHAWPRADRTAPEWWRLAWERCIPEPRLVLAGTLDAPLLPARGGGACPVQYDVFHRDRIFCVRFRSDSLSVTLERVGAFAVERDLFEEVLDCIEPKSIGTGGNWSHEETHVMLSLVSGAIRSGDWSTLRMPESIEALRASEQFMLGPYPLLVTRGPDQRWSEPFQASNLRWRSFADREESVPPAVTHHLATTRPPALGPLPARTRWTAFPWSPWSTPDPEPNQRRCAVRLLGRVTAHEVAVDRFLFIDEFRVVSTDENWLLRVTDLRNIASEPFPEALAAMMPDPDDGWMIDERREVAADGLELVISNHESGEHERRPGPGRGFSIVAVGPDSRVLIEDDLGSPWLWDIDGDRLDHLEITGDSPADVCVSLADGRLASGAYGLRIWDSETGQFQAEHGDFEGTAIAARGTTVVVGDKYGELWFFEVIPEGPTSARQGWSNVACSSTSSGSSRGRPLPGTSPA